MSTSSSVDLGAAQFNLADLFELVADAIPQRQALVAGRSRLTYEELDERASRLGAHLVSAGIEPGQRVAILAWNRAEWVEAMLGCFKIRAVPVNVNYRYVDRELRHVLSDADAVALITERSLAPKSVGPSTDLPGVRHVVLIEDGTTSDTPKGVEYEDALAASEPALARMARSANDRYLLYTGGTTGVPKGVVWRAEDIFFAALQGGRPGGDPISRPSEIAEGLALRSRPWLVTSPLMHGNGQWNTLTPLLSGRGAVLWTERGFRPEGVAALAVNERPELLVLIGDGMARPFAELLSREPATYELSKLRVIASGGALLSPTVKQELTRALPNVVIVDGFGASETGANGAAVEAGANGRARFRMGPGTTVVDDELRPTTPGAGVVGRLARTGHIPLAYHNDPQKTAATFPVGPDGTRWAIPGDQAIIEADGSITMLGRGSSCINTGGEKVYPDEVEAAVKSHPDVTDAIVIGAPHERFGQQVVVVAAPRSGQRPSLEALRDYLRADLAGYKLPRELVVVEAIRRTAAGKPDYIWAREVAAEATTRPYKRATTQSTTHSSQPAGGAQK